jgi:hypothetical protein
LIRFDPLPLVTQDDLDRLQAELLVKIGDCQQLVDPWFKYHRGYNPLWSPYPPEGLEVIHHWAVVVTGLPEDERVELRGPGGESLASALGGADQAARVAVAVEPAAEGRDVEIIRVGELHEELADGATRGLEVRQTDLIVLGEVPLAEPSHGVGLVELPSGPAVVALLADRVEAFDVRAGAPAGALASWQGRFHGILRSAGSSLLYGSDGVARLDTLGRLTPTAIDEPVVDAASGPEGAYFVTAERVLGLSSELTAEVRSDRADVTSVGGVGSTMLLGHARGVDVAGAALGAGVAEARGSLPPVAALSSASALRRGGLLATWADGSAGLLEERNGEPVEVVHYESTPMLAGAVRIGNRLVIATDGADRLRVLGLGRSVVL